MAQPWDAYTRRMIDPAHACLFIPDGLKKFKLNLFERIGRTVGRTIRGDVNALAALPADITPIVGCMPEVRPLIEEWQARQRPWIYWDRGYARRVFATWLPRGEDGGYYRWHIGRFQLGAVRTLPADRWDALQTPARPWRRDGRHIVVACPTPTYERFHRIEGWTDRTLRALARLTTRQVVTRDKESKRPLQDDLDGAWCLIAHGSNTAVEAAIMGCPVIVDASSAAALVGAIKLEAICQPPTPDRTAWLHSLAYSQFTERELIDGTLWRLLT